MLLDEHSSLSDHFEIITKMADQNYERLEERTVRNKILKKV